MSCLDVRELLPEHVIGVLTPHDASSVERHLEWCAACRKESGELQRAAATLAYSVAPVEPPPELEDRVVEAVRAVARRRGTRPGRRRGVPLILAAALSIAAVGWAVMAGRSGELRERVQQALAEKQTANRNLAALIAQVEGADPANVIELADLMSPPKRIGGGDALVLLSPSANDVALVAFTGVTVPDRRLPLEVWLQSDAVPDVLIGRIDTLDTDGGGGVRRWYTHSLRPYDAVVVRDARGTVLLHGTLSVYEPAA